MTQRKNVDIGPVIAMTRNVYRLVKIAPFIYAIISPSPKPLPLSRYRPISHFSGGCRNC